MNKEFQYNFQDLTKLDRVMYKASKLRIVLDFSLYLLTYLSN